jgi:hypothetical protein
MKLWGNIFENVVRRHQSSLLDLRHLRIRPSRHPILQLILRYGNFSFYFDLFKSPTFEIVYFLLCYNTFVLCRAIVVSDSLFLVCGLFICSYFKTLQTRLTNLKASDANSKINEIVEDHNRILELFTVFNKYFAPILIAKCLITGIAICVLGFQLLVVSFLFLFLKISSVLFLTCIFIGQFIYCGISSRIQNEVIFSFLNHSNM